MGDRESLKVGASFGRGLKNLGYQPLPVLALADDPAREALGFLPGRGDRRRLRHLLREVLRFP